MGAYGSPELPPLGVASRPPAPARRRHHSAPIRVILWSLAVVAASFAMMIVAAIILGTIEAVRATH